MEIYTFNEFLSNRKLSNGTQIKDFLHSVKFEAEYFYDMFIIRDYRILGKNREHAINVLRIIKEKLKTKNIMLCVKCVTPYEFGFWMEMLEKKILDKFLDLEYYNNLRDIYKLYKDQDKYNWSEFLLKSYCPLIQ